MALPLGGRRATRKRLKEVRARVAMLSRAEVDTYLDRLIAAYMAAEVRSNRVEFETSLSRQRLIASRLRTLPPR